MKTFKKDSFVPMQNPYDADKLEDSKVKFGCDVALLPCDMGYEFRPLKSMSENECIIKGHDMGEIPYWARDVQICGEPI